MTLDNLQTDPLATVADYYSQCLPDKAKAFAKQVGANGFADRSLGKQIPQRRTKLGDRLRDLLTEVGIFKPNGREVLRGRVTAPIVDEQGKVIGIRGYKLDPNMAGEDVIVVGHTEPTIDEDWTVDDDQILFRYENRRYRIRGIEKNSSPTALKVAILATRDDLVHLDSLDLVKASSRRTFIRAVAAELFLDEDVVKRDVGKLLLKLEAHRDEQIEARKQTKVKTVELTERETEEAIGLLRPQPAGPDRRRHSTRWRRCQQAGRIPCCDQSQTCRPTSDCDSIVFIGWQVIADGRRPIDDAR